MNEKRNFLKLSHHWITAGKQRKLHSQETTLELKSDNIEMLRHFCIITLSLFAVLANVYVKHTEVTVSL